MSFQLYPTKILIVTLMCKEKWSMHLVFLLFNSHDNMGTEYNDLCFTNEEIEGEIFFHLS